MQHLTVLRIEPLYAIEHGATAHGGELCDQTLFVGKLLQGVNDLFIDPLGRIEQPPVSHAAGAQLPAPLSVKNPRPCQVEGFFRQPQQGFINRRLLQTLECRYHHRHLF